MRLSIHQRRTKTLLACLASDVIVCLVASTLVLKVKKPNIVLIILDNLRADRLGCYGSALPTSPDLDALASVETVVSEVASWRTVRFAVQPGLHAN